MLQIKLQTLPAFLPIWFPQFDLMGKPRLGFTSSSVRQRTQHLDLRNVETLILSIVGSNSINLPRVAGMLFKNLHCSHFPQCAVNPTTLGNTPGIRNQTRMSCNWTLTSFGSLWIFCQDYQNEWMSDWGVLIGVASECGISPRSKHRLTSHIDVFDSSSIFYLASITIMITIQTLPPALIRRWIIKTN